MKSVPALGSALAAVLALAACSSKPARRVPGAQPTLGVSVATLDDIDPPDRARAPRRAPPDEIVLPATYVLEWRDGRQVLRRVDDERRVANTHATVRIVADEAVRRDLAVQPALLPQETAELIFSLSRLNAMQSAELTRISASMGELARNANESLRQSAAAVQRIAADELARRAAAVPAGDAPAAPAALPKPAK